MTVAARFASLLFTALVLGPSLAHLLELPAKIGLSREDYFIVQQIYRGWSLLGIVVIGALLSTLALSVLLRRRPREFAAAVASFLCLAAGQAVFWIFTFPMNQQTANWTMLPDNWTGLRAQWEYSHAAGCALNLLAFVALIWGVVLAEREAARRTQGFHPAPQA